MTRSVFGVSIAATALADRAAEPALQRAIHEDLLDDLAVHGHLVFASQEDLESFVEAVRALPTSLSKAWESVLSSRRVRVEVADPAQRPGLEEVLDPAALEARSAPEVALVLVEADQAELLGVPHDQFSAPSPGGLIEIGRIATAGRTATVLAARQTLDAPLREGASREVEWEHRFGPLVEVSSLLVIYDKYAGMQVARRYVYERAHGDGLTWFLTRAGRYPSCKVRVITAVTDDRSKSGETYDEPVLSLAFGRLTQALDKQPNLDLVLVPDRVRGEARRERFGHDRHVRFGQRAALALGTGVQAFATGHFPETITVARLPVADAKNREERAIRSALRPPPGGWLGWAAQG
jgi:hypothetical protein